ncbi:hypothetical protein FEF65_02475 [Mariprofundus erugo]|uniref:RHS repeat-associated core domain-containing protein n=1 Tax=Mariprofundus erugo TaxID=2528639 RepID=A0A5R9GXI8_9PROT|nr:RHS repeat domain-containing protein [Mariprofundus erugo]TLS68592.1 hypothetical protein FEF65_02475 [Mariprofundus erugo]
MSSERGGMASRSYVYECFGRVAASNTTISGQFYSVSTGYDSLGRVDTITYPTGLTVKQNYSPFFHMTSVTDAATGAMIWQANSSNEFGHLTAVPGFGIVVIDS